MDNLTHTLFALTLARTPLGRAGGGSTAVLLLASNAPDADAVAAVGRTLSYLQWHRGPTHGPLGIVGLGLLAAAIVRLSMNRFSRQPVRAAPFGRLAALGVIGVFGHVVMDLPTSYGTPLFSPFSWRWFSTDWMPIVDIYLIGILTAGLVFGQMRSTRTATPAGGGRTIMSSFDPRGRNAAIAIVLMLANYGVRAVAHDEALGQASEAFGPRLPQRCEGAESRLGLVNQWP